MHKKKINNNVPKKFIQGLRPLSTTLPLQVRKILKKNGFNLSSLVDNWTRIVGRDVSSNCYPINVKSQRGSKNVCLVLNVMHGKEMDIEYDKRNIIDKINTHFGYDYIKKIEVKIMNNSYRVKKHISPKKNKVNFDKNLRKINNLNLKNNLKKLIEAFNEK